MGKRSSGGLGAVLDLLLLLGLLIQVIKLLVVPLTILAIGAAVTVPVYLMTRTRRKDRKQPLTAASQTPTAAEDDGIVSQDEVLQLLPHDIASALTQGQHHEAVRTDSTSDPRTTSANQATEAQRPTQSPRGTANVHRHGSCSIKHRSLKAS